MAASCGLGGQQLWDADKVVGDDGEGEGGIDFRQTSQHGFGETSGLLHPAEDFFDAFSAALADRVSFMAQSTLVHGGLAGLAKL